MLRRSKCLERHEGDDDTKKEMKNAPLTNSGCDGRLGEECKLHGGPVSGDNLDLLDVLDESQVTKEVLFLKATIASELKIKKRVMDTSTKWYKMVKLPV